MADQRNDLDQPTRAAESPAVDHQPWRHPPIPLGQGVNLAKSVEQLAPGELARLTNGVIRAGGEIDTRWGLTQLLAGGTLYHSAYRLNDPNDSTYTRFWGLDGSLGRAQAGALDVVDGGYSGDPLTFATTGVPATAEPYLFVADRSRMRKITRTGSILPIGLPKPETPATAIVSILTTNIASFDTGDQTDSSRWQGTPGTDDSEPPLPTGTPSRADVTGLQGDCVEFTTDPGSAVGGYTSTLGLTYVSPLDLTKLQGGTHDAADDDMIHLWMRVDKPGILEELRVYFVVSPGFDPAVVPGTSESVNQQAYWKAFRAHDFTSAIELAEGTVAGGVTARARALVDQFFEDNRFGDRRDDIVQTHIAQRDPGRQQAPQTQPGRNVWSEFGCIGNPLRRRDFMKIGDSGVAATDWANVTGIIITVKTLSNEAIKLAFDDWFLTGGYELDSSTPGAQKYDVRVTDYDPRTGAESNPSDTQDDADHLDCLRQAIVVTPVANADGAIRQRAYIRGGVSLTDDWYYAGENDANGGEIVINDNEDTLLAAGGVEIDHDQPITTVNDDGDEVLAQSVPVILGPVLGFLLALGDPYRPGEVYRSKRNQPDHWPPDAHVTVCPAAEELMNGAIMGAQVMLFSRARGYFLQIDTDGTMVPMPTDCADGLAGRWAITTGPGGVFFVARDAVRVTTGGASQSISDLLRPLFRGETVNGYYPIDFTEPNSLRLGVIGDDLWFSFKDTNGSYVAWVLSFTYKTWRHVQFAQAIGCVVDEPVQGGGVHALVGGRAGKAFLHAPTAYTDDGTDIVVTARTGALTFGLPREEKLLGDLQVQATMAGADLTVQTFLNGETTSNTAAVVTGSAGFGTYGFEPFGTQPQHARSLSVELTWNGTTAVRPQVQQLTVSYAPQPPITLNRPTQWEPLTPNEGYLKGCWIDSDTNGEDRTVYAEVLLGGVSSIAATLTVNSAAGRRQWFSWPAVHADMVRLRPSDDCVAWMLFGQGWIADPEPARIARWDTNWENVGDAYVTGVDIECHTFGATKQIEVWADGEILESFEVSTAWRQTVHLTFDVRTPVRKHLLRLVAADENPGLLYTHTWYYDKEPSEQANWNQNFTTWSSPTDKWLKAFIIECDTFGETKTLQLDVDGVTTDDFLEVTHDGRLIKNYAFPQVKGRVFRLLPVDSWPSRPYNIIPVFDEEPYALTRWETQELTHGLGLQIPVRVQVTLRSTTDVTLSLQIKGQSGHVVATDTYTIPSTGGDKQMVWVPLVARKGLLFKWVFTSASEFTLYKPESYVEIQPWGGGEIKFVQPFGDDDQDLTRQMHNAALVAARGGVGRSAGGAA
jgi:hypothetical protein